MQSSTVHVNTIYDETKVDTQKFGPGGDGKFYKDPRSKDFTKITLGTSLDPGECITRGIARMKGRVCYGCSQIN